MVKTSLVNECKLFSTFNEKEKEVLSEFLNEVSFKKGKALFEEGSGADEFFFIRKGKIGLYRNDNFGNLTKVAEVHGGVPLGECAFFLGTPHSLRAIAEDDVRALSLSREKYELLKSNYPQLAIELIEIINGIVSERLKEEDKKFADIFCFFRVGGREWRK
ncbi:MAG: hypothetical protein DSZ26_01130 [Thermovibrio sp.]|nr:MAG: hypothetical protein DSZ26_01130 [Thermovibrio sp.]